MLAASDKQSLAVQACIDKIERWRADNAHFGHPTPEASPILTSLRQTLATGKFDESREGKLCEELARNEFRLDKAEKAMLANRSNPTENLPNVSRFTAEIAAQNEIISRITRSTP